MPFIRLRDSLTMAISQGSLRRGSDACYLPIDHPEIEEFIEIRRPTGGDPNRKALNLHNGILISDAFMRAVEADEIWELRSPPDRRSEERRVGKECVRTWRFRWSTNHEKHKPMRYALVDE